MNAPVASPPFTGWAVVLPSGHVVVEVGAHVTELTAWQIALGWPDGDEIAASKRAGARAFRCKMVEIEA